MFRSLMRFAWKSLARVAANSIEAKDHRSQAITISAMPFKSELIPGMAL
ncbi:hypothetical protein sync_2695 [Synechococcus sp. CC9311]|nr:hypothetical protein sync_2695 [Synechococcus sp. CC9311]